MKRLTRNTRPRTGGSIVEAAAALTLLLPLVIITIFVTLEVSYAYLLKSSLSEAAREGARSLSIAYGLDPTVANSRSTANQKAFDKIRIYNIVNDSLQFSDPTWVTTGDVPTVSVVVTYKSGQYGLPKFPYPDPLHLAGRFELAGNATYRLQ